MRFTAMQMQRWALEARRKGAALEIRTDGLLIVARFKVRGVEYAHRRIVTFQELHTHGEDFLFAATEAAGRDAQAQRQRLGGR